MDTLLFLLLLDLYIRQTQEEIHAMENLVRELRLYAQPCINPDG